MTGKAQRTEHIIRGNNTAMMSRQQTPHSKLERATESARLRHQAPRMAREHHQVMAHSYNTVCGSSFLLNKPNKLLCLPSPGRTISCAHCTPKHKSKSPCLNSSPPCTPRQDDTNTLQTARVDHARQSLNNTSPLIIVIVQRHDSKYSGTRDDTTRVSESSQRTPPTYPTSNL